MALDLTCLNVSSPLPTIPILYNETSVAKHSHYDPNGKAIAQRISSALTHTVFSTDDVQVLVRPIVKGETDSWDASTIIKMKPVTSVIIYSSVTLALFIFLAVLFCIISCNSCCAKRSGKNCGRTKKGKCSGKCVSAVIFLLIGLIVIGQMIYIAYQVRRTTVLLNDSVEKVNQEFYPKEVSVYLERLIRQLEALDRYSTQNDSIVINASRTLIGEAFKKVFIEKYHFDIINQSINENDLLFKEVEFEPVFQPIKDKHKEMIDYLEVPLGELCLYANGSEKDIDAKIFDALSLVHNQLVRMIDAIRNDFLSHVTPWENHMLMDQNLENQVKQYVGIVGTVLLVLIIVFGLMPIIFFIIIISCRCYYRRRRRSDVSALHVVPCWVRVVFIPMLIILFVILLCTGVLYAVDLVTQGVCRTVHDDQSFLVSLMIDGVFGADSVGLIVTGVDAEETFLTVIKDCANEKHFSEHFFQNHLNRSQSDVIEAMNALKGKVDKKFNASIVSINLPSHIDLLNQIGNNNSFSEEIRNITVKMIQHLAKIEDQFEIISSSVPEVPPDLVNQPVNDFQNYVKKTLETTIDRCPLPLATIYKADTLICHDFASAINGLWFSLWIYMFLIIFGLCIGGLWIYKKSDIFSSSSQSTHSSEKLWTYTNSENMF